MCHRSVNLPGHQVYLDVKLFLLGGEGEGVDVAPI